MFRYSPAVRLFRALTKRESPIGQVEFFISGNRRTLPIIWALRVVIGRIAGFPVRGNAAFFCALSPLARTSSGPRTQKADATIPQRPRFGIHLSASGLLKAGKQRHEG